MAIKCLFLGTPEFASPTLEVLLGYPEVFEVVGIVTQPDKPAGRTLEMRPSRIKSMAEEYLARYSKLAKKFEIFTPEKINTPEVLQRLYDLGADVAVVVAYGQILSTQFLNMFRFGAVNVHASLLPRWRGAAPIQWALLSQDPVTGVTLQRVTKELDAGDIIASHQVVLDDSWDAPKLYGELARKGADLVRKSLPDYVAGKITLMPQDLDRVTIAPKIKKEQGIIDWNKTAMDICAQIRALIPWPGTWTLRKGKTLKVLRANAMDFRRGEIGEVIAADKQSFCVQCGAGTALRIWVVQPESRARQPVAEYLKGYPFKKGDHLGV